MRPALCGALAVVIGACAASRGGVVHGAWGNAVSTRASLDAHARGGVLRLGCHTIVLDAPLAADARGEFRVRGTGRRPTGPMSRVPGDSVYSVDVRGRRLPDERLQLVIARPGASASDTLVLEPGIVPAMPRCESLGRR